MEGEAKMFDFSVLQPLQCMFNQMFRLDDSAFSIIPVIPSCLKVVKQVVVNVVNTQIIKLALEDLFDFIFITRF